MRRGKSEVPSIKCSTLEDPETGTHLACHRHSQLKNKNLDFSVVVFLSAHQSRFQSEISEICTFLPVQSKR